MNNEGEILGEGGGEEEWSACVGVWRLSGVWAAGEVGDVVIFVFTVADDDDASSATLAEGGVGVVGLRRWVVLPCLVWSWRLVIVGGVWSCRVVERGGG